MQRLRDAHPRQKKILNFISVTDEVCTSKDSTVVNKDCEQFLLSGDEISLLQIKPEGFRKLRVFFFPLFRLLKSTPVHRPSLKHLCHLNCLQKTLKKGFPFYTEVLCWSFTQWWLSVPCGLPSALVRFCSKQLSSGGNYEIKEMLKFSLCCVLCFLFLNS